MGPDLPILYPMLPIDVRGTARDNFYAKLPKMLEKYYEAIAAYCNMKNAEGSAGVTIQTGSEPASKQADANQRRRLRRKEKKAATRGEQTKPESAQSSTDSSESESKKPKAGTTRAVTFYKARREVAPEKDIRLQIREKQLDLEQQRLDLEAKRLETYAEIAEKTNKTVVAYAVDEQGKRHARKIIVSQKDKEVVSRTVEVRAPEGDTASGSWFSGLRGGKRVSCAFCSDTDVLQCGICFQDHYDQFGIQTVHAHKCKIFQMKIADGILVGAGAKKKASPRVIDL